MLCNKFLNRQKIVPTKNNSDRNSANECCPHEQQLSEDESIYCTSDTKNSRCHRHLCIKNWYSYFKLLHTKFQFMTLCILIAATAIRNSKNKIKFQIIYGLMKYLKRSATDSVPSVVGNQTSLYQQQMQLKTLKTQGITKL